MTSDHLCITLWRCSQWKYRGQFLLAARYILHSIAQNKNLKHSVQYTAVVIAENLKRSIRVHGHITFQNHMCAKLNKKVERGVGGWGWNKGIYYGGSYVLNMSWLGIYWVKWLFSKSVTSPFSHQSIVLCSYAIIVSAARSPEIVIGYCIRINPEKNSDRNKGWHTSSLQKHIDIFLGSPDETCS